jgi:outer membrane protein OmpA-like peptidoglycan-associated protein
MIDVDGLEGVYVQPDGMSKIKFNDLRKLEKEGLNWTLLKDANLLENLESPFIDIENKAQYIWCPEMIREGSGKKGAVISIDNLTGEDFFKVPELPVEIAEVETEKPVETEIPEKSKIKKIGNVPIDDIPEEGSVIFTKEIFFIQNSNEFKDYTSAKEDLDEIVQIMNDYPEYTLSIFGNIGTNNKSTTIDSKTTFTDINTGKIVDSTIGELMNIRAKRIYNYLIKEGIDASRLNYGQGAIYNNTTGLKTSFVLKN